MSKFRAFLWRLAERIFSRLFTWEQLERFFFAIEPQRLLQRIVYTSNGAPFELRLKYDGVLRPWYTYGLYHAALQAKGLDIPRITAVEFGVGGGDGLVALEHIAWQVESVTGVYVDVIGFDNGTGLPPPVDYRDVPYRWAEGEFNMLDPAPIRARLRKAELVLGAVKDTVGTVLERPGLAPIGFIAFDLDYYSSTKDAMVMLDAKPRLLLPRVFNYFDDCVGDDWFFLCEHVGELLAIREFNETHERRKLSLIYGLRHKRRIPAQWNEDLYVLHSFDHPLYTHHLPTWWLHDDGSNRKLGALREREKAEREAWLQPPR